MSCYSALLYLCLSYINNSLEWTIVRECSSQQTANDSRLLQIFSDATVDEDSYILIQIATDIAKDCYRLL